MSAAPELPVWAALLVAFLAAAGAAIALLGSAGLWRLDSFYARVHAPTLGATLGTGGVLIAFMLCFSVLEGRLVLGGILIALFVTVTTPVTLMLLARAALYRDRAEENPEVPGSVLPRTPD